MEKRFKPSIQEETKTEIMISLPRKDALDEKEQGTFLLIKCSEFQTVVKHGQHQDQEQKGKTRTATKAYEPNSWSYTWREKEQKTYLDT